jgi:division protein CdvB (Snf7/Vps24/ESCRT-III family)
MFVLEGTLRGHRCRILVDSSASKNFCKDEWVREHHIPTVSGEKYRIKLADGSTTTTRQRLRNEVLTIGTLDTRLDAIMIELDKFDIIFGQP